MSTLDDGDSDFHAALIGLGRRGCDCVQRLRRAGLTDAYGFLIDHEPDPGLEEETVPLEQTWLIPNAATVPDFSACGLLGIVLVGAEHQDKSEQLSLRVGLLKERPAVLLGVVLPPSPGERNRLRPELLRELDGAAYWPTPLELPASWARLQAAVTDLVDAVFTPGPIETDLADLIMVFGGARSVLIASATQEHPADPERMQATAYTALAELHEQGFKPGQATGMLVVMRGADDVSVKAGAVAHQLFRDILPDGATVAMAMPAGECWRTRTRVTLVAVGTFAGTGR